MRSTADTPGSEVVHGRGMARVFTGHDSRHLITRAKRHACHRYRCSQRRLHRDQQDEENGKQTAHRRIFGSCRFDPLTEDKFIAGPDWRESPSMWVPSVESRSAFGLQWDQEHRFAHIWQAVSGPLIATRSSERGRSVTEWAAQPELTAERDLSPIR